MQEEVLKPEGAWGAYCALRSDRRIGYVVEPAEMDEFWPRFTAGAGSSPNLWTDAYLCAFAAAASVVLVTFDTSMPGGTPRVVL